MSPAAFPEGSPRTPERPRPPTSFTSPRCQGRGRGGHLTWTHSPRTSPRGPRPCPAHRRARPTSHAPTRAGNQGHPPRGAVHVFGSPDGDHTGRGNSHLRGRLQRTQPRSLAGSSPPTPSRGAGTRGNPGRKGVCGGRPMAQEPPGGCGVRAEKKAARHACAHGKPTRTRRLPSRRPSPRRSRTREGRAAETFPRGAAGPRRPGARAGAGVGSPAGRGAPGRSTCTDGNRPRVSK